MEVSTRLETMIHVPSSGLPESAGTLPAEGDHREFWYSWKVIKEAQTAETFSAVKVDNSDLYEFRERAAALGPQVYAILVEAGETEERHVTTFLTKSTPELEAHIYALEAEIIEKYCDRIFDFHVRTVPTDDQGNRVLPPGETYFMLTWQSPLSHGDA